MSFKKVDNVIIERICRAVEIHLKSLEECNVYASNEEEREKVVISAQHLYKSTQEFREIIYRENRVKDVQELCKSAYKGYKREKSILQEIDKESSECERQEAVVNNYLTYYLKVKELYTMMVGR